MIFRFLLRFDRIDGDGLRFRGVSGEILGGGGLWRRMMLQGRPRRRGGLVDWLIFEMMRERWLFG